MERWEREDLGSEISKPHFINMRIGHKPTGQHNQAAYNTCACLLCQTAAGHYDKTGPHCDPRTYRSGRILRHTEKKAPWDLSMKSEDMLLISSFTLHREKVEVIPTDYLHHYRYLRPSMSKFSLSDSFHHEGSTCLINNENMNTKWQGRCLRSRKGC